MTCSCFGRDFGTHTEECRLRARVQELELENSNLRVRDSNVTAHCLNVNAINEDYRDKLAAETAQRERLETILRGLCKAWIDQAPNPESDPDDIEEAVAETLDRCAHEVSSLLEANAASGQKSQPEPRQASPIPVTRNFICLACGARLRTDPSKPMDQIDGCAFCPIRTSAELTKWIEGTAPAPVSDEELQARVWHAAAIEADTQRQSFGVNSPGWIAMTKFSRLCFRRRDELRKGTGENR